MASSARILPLATIPLVLAVGCGDAGDGGSDPADGDVAGRSAAADVVRTADPYSRGYTDDDFPRVQELAPGVYSYEQLRSAGDERFTTVSLFVVGEDGVLVADGQGSVEETDRLIEHIREVTDLPIRHVVISSDHGDHTGGNAAFPDDAEVYAHPTSAATLRAAAGRSAAADGPKLPTVLVDERHVVDLGRHEVELLFLGRAHTGGDLVVYLPEERILFMSETYLHRVFPAMRSAYPSEWVAMIARAQELDVETYVPGHGFVDSPEVLREELETYKQAMITVIAEAKRLHEAGIPVEEAMELAEFGDLEGWSLRESQGARAVQQVYAELNGTLEEPTG